MHIRPFEALYPDQALVTAEPEFFDNARESYPHFLQAGFFNKTDTPALFLYQIQASERRYTGVLACTDLHDYLEGDIKKHENTIRAEEEKQMRLTLEREAAVKPVLLTYPENEEIDQFLDTYAAQHPVFLELHFPADQQIHRLWAIREPESITRIQQLFVTNVPHAYIADGHHRMCAMALIVENTKSDRLRRIYSDVFCSFFPSRQLDILEFNRVVEIQDGTGVLDFLKNLEQLFDIQPLDGAEKPAQLHEMTFCTILGWYRLRWKPEVLQEFAGERVILDTMLLNELVLNRLLGIREVRDDRRVSYINAPKGLEAIQTEVANQLNRVGFCLYPVQFEDLKNLVEAGKTLPPKSTWFEPRMKNGVIVKPYDGMGFDRD